jgi:DNA-binding response OmpR family regulator
MPLANVLVVEDDTAIRRGLIDALTFAGYAVREAPDGRAGLDAALAPGVDLVLLLCA